MFPLKPSRIIPSVLDRQRKSTKTHLHQEKYTWHANDNFYPPLEGAKSGRRLIERRVGGGIVEKRKSKQRRGIINKYREDAGEGD